MSKYIKKETKGQIIFIVMIILAIAIGLLWNELEDSTAQKWEPEEAYPMVNAHISWEQTYHGGAWNVLCAVRATKSGRSTWTR